MPKRELHDMLNRLVLGATYSRISEFMDKPYSKFRRRHRALRHDTALVLQVLKRFGLRPALAAWLHIALDEDRELQRRIKAFETLREVSGKSQG